MERFSLENQYQLYLKRMKLNESKMHPEQKKQLKETFFGATGQMLLLFRDGLTELSDEDAIKQMQSMLDQIGNFFLKATNKFN